MRNFETDRERAANDLAERLFFELEKQGNCVAKLVITRGGIVRLNWLEPPGEVP